MDVQVGRRSKALDQRDRAAVGLVGRKTSLPELVAREHAVHHLQHGRQHLGLRGQQQSQLPWLGWWIGLAAMFAGLGALLLQVRPLEPSAG